MNDLTPAALPPRQDRLYQATAGTTRRRHGVWVPLHLQPGLFEEYASDIMGPPQRVEGYSWGTVWFYRTAVTKGTRTTPETDSTPLVFDRRRVLFGWGSDFLARYSHRQPSLGGGVRQ
jgi:hypothetical protein